MHDKGHNDRVSELKARMDEVSEEKRKYLNTGEGESQKIEAVMRKGYLFQGNLIRPAMVKVKSE